MLSMLWKKMHFYGRHRAGYTYSIEAILCYGEGHKLEVQ